MRRVRTAAAVNGERPLQSKIRRAIHLSGDVRKQGGAIPSLTPDPDKGTRIPIRGPDTGTRIFSAPVEWQVALRAGAATGECTEFRAVLAGTCKSARTADVGEEVGGAPVKPLGPLNSLKPWTLSDAPASSLFHLTAIGSPSGR